MVAAASCGGSGEDDLSACMLALCWEGDSCSVHHAANYYGMCMRVHKRPFCLLSCNWCFKSTAVLVTRRQPQHLHLHSCREDLVNALNKLYDRREQIDHIIIETTGLANPGPIVSSFYMDRWAACWSVCCLCALYPASTWTGGQFFCLCFFALYCMQCSVAGGLVSRCRA
jgi:hypothetical protein